jgi:heme-degrading monooxygenase HmoA
MTVMRVARYSSSSSADSLRQRVADELIPLYQEQPGFKMLSVALDGEHILSVSHWDSAEHAQSGSGAAKEWAAGQDDIGPPDVSHIGEVLGSA